MGQITKHVTKLFFNFCIYFGMTSNLETPSEGHTLHNVVQKVPRCSGEPQGAHWAPWDGLHVQGKSNNCTLRTISSRYLTIFSIKWNSIPLMVSHVYKTGSPAVAVLKRKYYAKIGVAEEENVTAPNLIPNFYRLFSVQ